MVLSPPPPLPQQGGLTKPTFLSQTDMTAARLLSDLIAEHEKAATGTLQPYQRRA